MFSLAPTVYELSRMGDIQPNRQFELVHNFPTDYNFYLSRIREGLEGRWTVIERYTSEPHNGSLIHEFYVLMGQTGRFLRVPTYRVGDIYHMARVVLAIALLVAIAEFCKRSFALGSMNQESGVMNQKTQKTHSLIHNSLFMILSFLLAVTASSWPKLIAVVNTQIVPANLGNLMSWRFGGYMAWWSVMDSLQRITFIPHMVAGQALIIVCILLLTNPAFFTKSITVVFTGLLLFILGMIFPPGLLFVYGVIGIWAILSWKKMRPFIAAYVSMAVMGGASLLYLFLMTGMYPWRRLAEVDSIRPLPFDYLEYVKALGPMLPAGLLGLIVALYKREAAFLPAVSWVIAWGIFLVGFAFIPQQSPLRFSEMIPHVPLGVLTAYLFYWGRGWFFARFEFRRLSPLNTELGIMNYAKKNKRMSRQILTIIHTSLFIILPIALVAIGMFHMYSSYLWQKDFVDHKIRATYPLVPTGSYVMYPLKDFTDAMWYLYDHAPRNSVILSETTAGNYIPVVSGHVVFVGHDNTVGLERKKEDVAMFFSGRMNARTAQEFLQVIGVSYIYFGPQEREEAGGRDLEAMYPFLIPLYYNDHVTIYTAP